MPRDSKDRDPTSPSDPEAAGKAARGDEPAGDARKERVIHTRVPAVLEQELKRLAETIRVPVSNLVRTILEDAVEMADRAGRGVEQELRHAASTLSSKREHILKRKADAVAASKRPLDGVIGFQPLTLASSARCARCEAALHEGDEAFLGVSADPTAARAVVCSECLPRGRGDQKQEHKIDSKHESKHESKKEKPQ